MRMTFAAIMFVFTARNLSCAHHLTFSHFFVFIIVVLCICQSCPRKCQRLFSLLWYTQSTSTVQKLRRALVHGMVYGVIDPPGGDRATEASYLTHNLSSNLHWRLYSTDAKLDPCHGASIPSEGDRTLGIHIPEGRLKAAKYAANYLTPSSTISSHDFSGVSGTVFELPVSTNATPVFAKEGGN